MNQNILDIGSHVLKHNGLGHRSLLCEYMPSSLLYKCIFPWHINLGVHDVSFYVAIQDEGTWCMIYAMQLQLQMWIKIWFCFFLIMLDKCRTVNVVILFQVCCQVYAFHPNIVIFITYQCNCIDIFVVFYIF